MNKNLTVIFLLFFCLGFTQSKQEQMKEIEKFQTELIAEYKNLKETPLRGENFENFVEHPFFPVDLDYRVNANFERSLTAVAFDLPTSSGKTKPYIEYGTATFNLKGKPMKLRIYQSLNLIKTPGYENYLFLPFRDATNGKETYGGGKYIDLKIPENNSIVIDFNQSYQPFCAYNAYDYSCPIVPPENFLEIEIKAGVKYDDVYHDQ